MSIANGAIQNTLYGSLSEQRVIVTTAPTYTDPLPDTVIVSASTALAIAINVPSASDRFAWQGENKGQMRVTNLSSYNATFTPASGTVNGNAIIPPGGAATFIVAGGVWNSSLGSGAAGTGAAGTSITALAADITSVTNAMANMTALSQNVVAGAVYKGRMVIKATDSTAAEGAAFDFDGGTSTATAFAAGAGLLTGGTTVQSVGVSSALATDLVWTTITGESWLTIEFTLTVNAGGTFIPRYAQGTAHSSGTLTVSRGTTLSLARIS